MIPCDTINSDGQPEGKGKSDRCFFLFTSASSQDEDEKMERMEFLDLCAPKNGTRSGFGPGFGYASPMLVHEFLCYNSKFCVIFLKIRPVKEGEPVMNPWI